MIKSTQVTTKFANKIKQGVLLQFLLDYRNAVEFYVDYLWLNKNRDFYVPNFISTKTLNPTTCLSQRALKCASTQACGIVSAALKKRQKQTYMLKKLMRAGEDTRKLQRKIDTTPLVKPAVPKLLPAELNSICCKLMDSSNSFDNWLVLSSLGKQYGRILIPIKQTRHSRRLEKSGKPMTSFLISPKTINIRYDISIPETKTSGQIIGADQGVTTCLSMSDGQLTKTCSHGHDLSSISKKLSRKTKGSRAFKRAQQHRTNYINWSLNQLDLDVIKEFRLERLYQMRKGQQSSRFLSHFTYTEIREKMRDRCNLLGIKFVEQDNVYRSQRCSSCGFVHKSNRKGKEFICRGCGYYQDADLNSAMNHAVDLVELPFDLRRLRLNISGFYWKSDGLFNVSEQAITVPVN
jgi:transposase